MPGQTDKSNNKGKIPTHESQNGNAKMLSGRKPATMSSAVQPGFKPAPEPRDTDMPDASVIVGDEVENGSDNDEIEEYEREEESRKLAEGAANAIDSKIAKPPKYLHDTYKSLFPVFEEFWTSKDDFPKATHDTANKAIKKLMAQEGDDFSQTVGCIPFDTYTTAKKNALGNFDKWNKKNKVAKTKAWFDADKLISTLRQRLETSGFPAEFGPPENWIEHIVNIERPGAMETEDSTSLDTSNGSSGIEDSSATSVQNEKWDPDADDSIEELSRAAGAKVPLVSTDGEVCGYSRRGGHFEVLVKEGKDTNVRYRLVPAKAAVAFNPSRPNCQNLALGQRGSERHPETGVKMWHAKNVKALKAVAWRQDGQDDNDDPVKDMKLTSEARQCFPVTRVKVLWSDNKETWETRTTLRSLYPRETADAMIYQRAGIQEAKYRRGQGLSEWNFERIKLPSNAPNFSNSASSRGSSRYSKKSRSVAPSRVSFDDDLEDEEPAVRKADNGGVLRAEFSDLQRTVQDLTDVVQALIKMKMG